MHLELLCIYYSSDVMHCVIYIGHYQVGKRDYPEARVSVDRTPDEPGYLKNPLVLQL